MASKTIIAENVQTVSISQTEGRHHRDGKLFAIDQTRISG
jgi:hypothetical protein